MVRTLSIEDPLVRFEVMITAKFKAFLVGFPFYEVAGLVCFKGWTVTSEKQKKYHRSGENNKGNEADFHFCSDVILKYKVDIGTDDGVLAELKSVIDVNPMNSTFVNQRINLQFDTCYEQLLYSCFCSRDYCN